MDDKELQIYQLLYQAYADEIKNLWQRSIFLATFMVLVWTGYGALQLKALDKDFSVSAGYCLVSFGLCGVIIILSLLWIAMAKGSKFVQEAHEEHIENFDWNCLKGENAFIETNDMKKLFCKLKDYEDNGDTSSDYRKKISVNSFLCCCGALEPYRYSPSKINIALGCLSGFVATILGAIHIFLAFNNKCCIFIPFIFTACIYFAIRYCLKGEN